MAKSKLNYATLFASLSTLNIPVYDFENHLKCDFSLENRLGSGAAMEVYPGYLQRTADSEPIKVAIKIPKKTLGLKTRDGELDRVLSDIRQELRMMKYLEAHPNIIDLYGVALKNYQPAVVVEFAVGTVTDFLGDRNEDGNPVSWPIKTKICCDVADGIKALHTVHIVHGDIKADNILLFGDLSDEEKLVAKISDFGYSSTIQSIVGGMGSTGGTPHFWPPECLPSAPPEIKLYENKPTKDNYAFGLFVWQVAENGEVPYEDLSIEEIVKAKEMDPEITELIERLPEDTPDTFKNVIIGMTRYAADQRIDFANVNTLMDADQIISTEDPSYLEAKKTFEANAKEIPRDINDSIQVELLQRMSIPSSVMTKLIGTYEKAAKTGDAESAYFLSVCYGTGFGVKSDKEKMILWAVKSAENGSLQAVKTIASHYDVGELPESINTLFPWLLKAAETGHTKSQEQVSMCYMCGICVEEDMTKAEEWQRKADQGRQVTVQTSEPALHRATRENKPDTIKFLLKQEGADVNAEDNKGQTPLHVAAEYGNKELVKLLLEQFHANVNAKDKQLQTPLHMAAEKGHLELVRLLIEEFHAEVDSSTSGGRTPLHFAALYGHTEIVKILAEEFHADASLKDGNLWSILHIAAIFGHVDIARLALEKFHANVEEPDKDANGWRPLHMAVLNEHEDIVMLLAGEFHADIDAKDSRHRTALHKAATKGNAHLTKLLIEQFHANVNLKDKDGLTPLDEATEKNSNEVVRILKNFGAKPGAEISNTDG